MKIDYNFKELNQEMDILKNTFDVVRIVSPDTCEVCSMGQNSNGGIVFNHIRNCYNTWSIDKRCSNCISARAIHEKGIFTKLEYLNDNIFLIHSKCVCIEGTLKAMEMVKDVTNSLNFNTQTEYKIQKNISDFNCEINLDTLTQVYNRRYMIYHFNDIIRSAKKKQKDIHMAVIDIDHFKIINDTYGDSLGDELLKKVADNIRKFVMQSPYDYIVRLGGDKFIVLSIDREFNEFKNSLNCLLEYFQNNAISYNNSKINMTLSIGTVNGSISKMYDLNEIVTLSNARLDIAKESGRNMVI